MWARPQKVKAVGPQRHRKVGEQRVVESIGQLLVGHGRVVAVTLFGAQRSLRLLECLAGVLGLYLLSVAIRTFAVMIGFCFTGFKYIVMGVALVLIGVAAS